MLPNVTVMRHNYLLSLGLLSEGWMGVRGYRKCVRCGIDWARGGVRDSAWRGRGGKGGRAVGEGRGPTNICEEGGRRAIVAL